MRKTIYANGIIVGELDVVAGDPMKAIEQITEFLRAKGIHREVTKEQAMFRQALSFCKTAAELYDRELKQAPRSGLAAVPFVVNAAFSIELYLKTLYQLAGSRVRGHELLTLYDGLADDTRRTVVELAATCASKFSATPVPSADEFRGFVSDLNTAFVDWRYCYETGSVDVLKIQPTILVMCSLDQACRKLGAT
jgi:HEPN domain-containing protein